MRPERAAYGFRVDGIDGDDSLALHGAGAWPQLHVERQIESDPGPLGARVTEREASIQTPAGRLVLDRATNRVVVHSREPVACAELVHPCLWPAAAVFARWLGSETLHAGAFAAQDGRAWVVLGERSAGKSSLLAALATAGHQVLADDLVVVDGPDCFAGPRCVDLRADAAAALGIEEQTSLVRATERRRLALPAVHGRVALRGFLYLGWDERVSLEPVDPAEHFGLLVGHRRVAVLGADIGALMDLGGLPAVRLCRPRSWDVLAEACHRLVDELSGRPG